MIASVCVLFALSCTPREIEQETVREMPRPDGKVQRALDSIKRELAIKRLEKEVIQRMMDSVERKLIRDELERDAKERR